MIWHNIFLYKKPCIGNCNRFAEAFNSVSTCSRKLHVCCPGPSLLAHRRASSLRVQMISRSWGSGPSVNVGRKQSRSSWWDLPRGGHQVPGCWHFARRFSGCTKAGWAQGTFLCSVFPVWKGKRLLLQDWTVTEATPLGSPIEPPRPVGTAFSSKIAGLVYMCFILSYSNLFTRDRNPGKSILKACWHLSTWQIIKAPWKSQEKTCKPLTKLYDVNAKRRRSAG